MLNICCTTTSYFFNQKALVFYFSQLLRQDLPSKRISLYFRWMGFCEVITYKRRHEHNRPALTQGLPVRFRQHHDPFDVLQLLQVSTGNTCPSSRLELMKKIFFLVKPIQQPSVFASAASPLYLSYLNACSKRSWDHRNSLSLYIHMKNSRLACTIIAIRADGACSEGNRTTACARKLSLRVEQVWSRKACLSELSVWLRCFLSQPAKGPPLLIWVSRFL